MSTFKSPDRDWYHGYHIGAVLIGDEIHSRIDVQSGDIITTIQQTVIRTHERLIREKLIELGWTPPPEKP